MATFTPEQFAAQGGTITQPTGNDNAYQSFLNSAKTTGFKNTPQEGIISKFSNAASGMAKDALNTLVVKRATRVAQAAVQTYNEFQNPGYDTAVDTGSPTRKNAGGTATPIASPSQPTNTNTSNSETKLQQPSTSLSTTTEPQQTGTAGAKQIAGDALKSASYLAIPEAAEETAGATSLAGKVGKGLLTGAAVGASGGAGEELQNPDSTTGSVLQAGGKGALVGAAVGGALPVAVEGLKAGSQALSDIANKPEIEKPVKLSPEMQQVQDNVVQSQQDLETAKSKADDAAEQRKTAAPQAVEGVRNINAKVSSHLKTLGEQFGSDAQDLEKAQPKVKLNLTNEQVDALNALKENKNFSLPDKINKANLDLTAKGGGGIDLSGATPEMKAQIAEKLGKAGGQTSVSLSPTEAQDLITELNRSTFRQAADGSLVKDYQRIGITNEIKDAASQAFGGKWDEIYSKYSQGRGMIDKIDSFTNLDPKATPEELNKQLEGILKQSKTPEGKLLLQQSINEYKLSSGIDLNDPVKAIQQIADKQTALDEANSGLSDAQKAAAKVQRDAEVTQIKQEQKMSTFGGRHPVLKQNAGYMARRTVGGAISIGLLYPAIKAIMKAAQGK